MVASSLSEGACSAAVSTGVMSGMANVVSAMATGDPSSGTWSSVGDPLMTTKDSPRAGDGSGGVLSRLPSSDLAIPPMWQGLSRAPCVAESCISPHSTAEHDDPGDSLSTNASPNTVPAAEGSGTSSGITRHGLAGVFFKAVGDTFGMGGSGVATSCSIRGLLAGHGDVREGPRPGESASPTVKLAPNGGAAGDISGVLVPKEMAPSCSSAITSSVSVKVLSFPGVLS